MHFVTIFIYFILYSILGWIYETTYCSIKALKWDDRGMLNGPCCPIYGIGAVLDILLCTHLPNTAAVFFVCMFGSAILEYATSYATERLFHAVWWDYSYLPFNLNGRICLTCSLSIGAAGIIVLYYIQPVVARIIEPIPLYLQEPLALFLMAIFAADCALTADSLAQINAKLTAVIQNADNQIAERYESFIENTKQNLSDGFDSLKGRVTLEEFREKQSWEDIKKLIPTLSWSQIHAVRSSVSFRRPGYSEMGSKMKQLLTRKKKNKETMPKEGKKRNLFRHTGKVGDSTQ